MMRKMRVGPRRSGRLLLRLRRQEEPVVRRLGRMPSSRCSVRFSRMMTMIMLILRVDPRRRWILWGESGVVRVDARGEVLLLVLVVVYRRIIMWRRSRSRSSSRSRSRRLLRMMRIVEEVVMRRRW